MRKKKIKKMGGKLGAKIKKKYFKDLGVKESLYRVKLPKSPYDNEQTMIITNSKSLIDECNTIYGGRKLKLFINAAMMKSQRKYYIGKCKCIYDYDDLTQRFFFSKIISHTDDNDIAYLPVFYTKCIDAVVNTENVKCVYIIKFSVSDTIIINNEVHHQIIDIDSECEYVGKTFKELFDEFDVHDSTLYPVNYNNIVSVNTSPIPIGTTLSDICFDLRSENFTHSRYHKDDDKSEVTDALMGG